MIFDNGMTSSSVLSLSASGCAVFLVHGNSDGSLRSCSQSLGQNIWLLLYQRDPINKIHTWIDPSQCSCLMHLMHSKHCFGDDVIDLHPFKDTVGRPGCLQRIHIMGVFDTYCSFCAGPLEDGREQWLSFLQTDKEATWPPKDGEWLNPPGYAVPSAPIDEIVTISQEDGATWADWVCVGSIWPGYVSPPCTQGDYGAVEIDGSSEWMGEAGRFIRIHRICLSFLCRRVAITPEVYWTTLFGPDSDYVKYGDRENGLLYCLKYFDMTGRNGQSFGYATECQTPHDDEPEIVDRWNDPDSMTDTAWILSRPTVLPAPQPLGPSPIKVSGGQSKAPCMRVFEVPVIFDAILDSIVGVNPEIITEELKLPSEEIDAPTLTTALAQLTPLTQVDRWFYQAIIRERQSLFLRLAQQFGWMLPCTPSDWENWSAPSPIAPGDFNWRAYIQTCLKKDDHHLRNRYRFHSMAVQIARGRARYDGDGEVTWQWNAGKLGVKTPLEKPTPYDWETVQSS